MMKLDATLTILALLLAGSSALAASMAMDPRGDRMPRQAAWGLSLIAGIGLFVVLRVLAHMGGPQ